MVPFTETGEAKKKKTRFDVEYNEIYIQPCVHLH